MREGPIIFMCSYREEVQGDGCEDGPKQIGPRTVPCSSRSAAYRVGACSNVICAGSQLSEAQNVRLALCKCANRASGNVRLPPHRCNMNLRKILRRMGPERSASSTDPLADWPDLDTEEGRRIFWDDYHRYYHELRRDPVAWREELRERAAWDPSLVSPADLTGLS